MNGYMANVTFNLTDCLGNPYWGTITLTPQSIVTGSGYIVMADSVNTSVTTSGNTTFSNLVSNTYLVGILAGRIKNEFFISVPTGSLSYSASALIIPTTGSIY